MNPLLSLLLISSTIHSTLSEDCPSLPELGSPVNIFSEYFRSFFEAMNLKNDDSSILLLLYNSKPIEDIITNRFIWRLNYNDDKVTYIGILSTFPAKKSDKNRHNIVRFIQTADISDAKRLLGVYEGSETEALICAGFKARFKEFYEKTLYSPIAEVRPVEEELEGPQKKIGEVKEVTKVKDPKVESLLTTQSVDSLNQAPIDFGPKDNGTSQNQQLNMTPQHLNPSPPPQFNTQKTNSPSIPIQSNTPQPANLVTPQPASNLTNQSNTPQPVSNPTPQPINPSIPQPIDLSLPKTTTYQPINNPPPQLNTHKHLNPPTPSFNTYKPPTVFPPQFATPQHLNPSTPQPFNYKSFPTTFQIFPDNSSKFQKIIISPNGAISTQSVPNMYNFPSINPQIFSAFRDAQKVQQSIPNFAPGLNSALIELQNKFAGFQGMNGR